MKSLHSPENSAAANAYRPDIDGLRAAAVLAVCAYHAFPSVLKGGFIGVDVFFVISGYLISGIILNDLERNTFSLWNFYNRRIRRIFPALTAVLAATLVFGCFALFPDEYRALGKHAFGGASFSSNFFLWREAGYFDAAARAKPLLHLWSLGIEEQFYIFFPLLMWACAKKRLRLITVVLAIFSVSFLINIYCLRYPAADFYSPLSRIWELLAGAGLRLLSRRPTARRLYLRLDALFGRAIYEERPENDGRSLGLALALSGFALLGASLGLVGTDRPYPGWQALWPVLGTLFLIAAGPENPISRHLLAGRAAVFTGLVSYPLYLWHWPLLSYAFILNGGREAGPWLAAGLLAASFTLAVLTYFMLEKPIRFGSPPLAAAYRFIWKNKHKHTLQSRGQVTALCAALAFIGFCGALVYHWHGFPGRTAMRSVEDVLSHTKWGLELQHSDVCQKHFSYPYCQLAADAPPTMAILGDSFANAYFPGLAGQFSRRGENLVQLGRGGCPPLLDIEAIQEGRGVWCMNSTQNAIREIAALPSVHTVILAAQWHLYIVEKKNLNPDLGGPDNPPRLIRRLPPEEPGQTNIEVFNSQFRKTLDLLLQSGKKIVVLKQTPELSFDPIACLVKRPMSLRKNMPCTLTQGQAKEYLAEYEAVLDGVLADYPMVKILDPVDIFFPEGEIILSKDYIPLFRDVVPHLSHFGSAFVADELMRQWP